MAKADLAEMTSWTLKQAFFGLKKQSPGRLYVWFSASDWANIQECNTIEEKLSEMIECALYISIDASLA